MELGFETWYHTEWISHVEDSGASKTRVTMVMWLFGGLISANVAALATVAGFLIKLK